MYRVAVKRDFVAQHFLIGGDWGAENQLHSHHYFVEVQLSGTELDEHGYLVDIVDIETQLDKLVSYYKDQTLNHLIEFNNLNPSIEHFSRIFCQQFHTNIQSSQLAEITTQIWENEIAWASFTMDLS
jgi:6-pyruvoyltetrahydropterin/6-carboxytetrahydropterin synthase